MESNTIRSIAEVQDLKGKYVFVRAPLNVPITDGRVTNTFRIQQCIPTITHLCEAGARVILCSHVGKDGTESIAPVYEVLKEHFTIKLSSQVVGEETTALRNALQDGEVLLLENVRKEEGEMKNDTEFAQSLADLADIYVNDDFAASHREHASLHAITKLLPSYGGLSLLHEFEELSKALHPVSPSLFILGGAKFETKMPLVEKFLGLYDHIFIGGALADDFFKAQGHEVGTSLLGDPDLQLGDLISNEKVLLPNDVTVSVGTQRRVTDVSDVHTDEAILDAGPASIAMLTPYIQNAKTILWNGPLGYYEGGFQEQTLACAKLIADSDAYSVVGGGDTVAAIESSHLSDSFGFLSTAGGAMLTFLELGSLPALDALRASKQ